MEKGSRDKFLMGGDKFIFSVTGWELHVSHVDR